MRLRQGDIFFGMKCSCLFAAAGLLVVLGGPSTAGAAKDIDAAFAAFWEARTPQEAARRVPDVVASGVSFDDAVTRLRAGRPYSSHVPKGVVRRSHVVNGVEYFYAVNVPPSYDPGRRYQVRFQLHGGVSRESNAPRGDGTIGALAGAEQIYIIPYAWQDAPWWSDEQLANVRTLLDTVKRTYNVDENRVAVAGVSDGGTGAYYIAMRDMTPFSSFLTLNGFVLVLRSVVAGDLFANNLRNKPFFIVNGGRDPLYPTRAVEPYVQHLKQSGVELVYQPQEDGVHNTAWWPDVKDSFEEFVRTHPRNPLPETLTWQSSGQPVDNRADWLVIDKLAPQNPGAAPLDDLNRIGDSGQTLFDRSQNSGRVDLVRAGNTVKATTRGVLQFTLLLSPDAFDFSKPVRVETNGQVAFEGPVAASLPSLMKWAAHDNDRSMLFGAELQIAVR
jgi:acetyl esterase/lipase